MLASLIPLRRLPKAFDTFTYAVPPELEQTLQVGQLVQIPFRNSQTFGIVFSLEHKDATPLPRLKSITKIIFEHPLLPPGYLLFLQKISQISGGALSTLFEMALPEFTPRILKQLTVPEVANRQPHTTLPEYKKYNSPEEHKKILLESLRGQTMIFVPEKQYLETLFQFLPPSLQQQTVFWHGELTPAEKRKNWCAIRNKEKNIILSTRSGAFLPLCQVDTLLIDYEHHREHKNADQTPRLHIKDITPLIREYTGATEIHLSSCVSIESYYGLYKGGYQNTNPKQTLQFEKREKNLLPRVVDMNNERKAGNTSPLCETLETKIKESNQNIFLFINRKGAGSLMICKDCRHEELCSLCHLPLVYHAKTKILLCHYCKTQKPIPLSCPRCGSVMLEWKGVGTESIEKRVRELLREQEAQKNIIRVDGEMPPHHTTAQEQQSQNKPTIFIGTEKAFSFVPWEKISVLAMLDLDRQVSLPEYKALEYAWNLVEEIQYCRSKTSEFFIQTWDPKQLILKSLGEPDRLYRTDLNVRQSLGYPPYGFLVRYFYGGASEEIGLQEAKKVYTTLEQVLTNHPKHATMTGPVELQPKYYRGRWWYGIIIKIQTPQWFALVCELNTHIPAGWKIDPNPTTLLHP